MIKKYTSIAFFGSVLRTRLWSCPGVMDLQLSSAGLSVESPPAKTVIKWRWVDSWEKSCTWQMENRYSFTVSGLFSSVSFQVPCSDKSWQPYHIRQLLLQLTRSLFWPTGSVVSLRAFWGLVTRSPQFIKCLWSLWLPMTGKSWWVSIVTGSKVKLFY